MATFSMCAKCGAIKLQDCQTKEIFWQPITPLEQVAISAISASEILPILYGENEITWLFCDTCSPVKPLNLN